MHVQDMTLMTSSSLAGVGTVLADTETSFGALKNKARLVDVIVVFIERIRWSVVQIPLLCRSAFIPVSTADHLTHQDRVAYVFLAQFNVELRT